MKIQKSILYVVIVLFVTGCDSCNQLLNCGPAKDLPTLTFSFPSINQLLSTQSGTQCNPNAENSLFDLKWEVFQLNPNTF